MEQVTELAPLEDLHFDALDGLSDMPTWLGGRLECAYEFLIVFVCLLHLTQVQELLEMARHEWKLFDHKILLISHFFKFFIVYGGQEKVVRVGMVIKGQVEAVIES